MHRCSDCFTQLHLVSDFLVSFLFIGGWGKTFCVFDLTFEKNTPRKQLHCFLALLTHIITCVRACTHSSICTHAFMHTLKHMHTLKPHTHTHTHMHAYTLARTHAHTHTHTHTHTKITEHMCICMPTHTIQDNTIQYNTNLLSLCREICFLARHLHKNIQYS